MRGLGEGVWVGLGLGAGGGSAWARCGGLGFHCGVPKCGALVICSSLSCPRQIFGPFLCLVIDFHILPCICYFYLEVSIFLYFLFNLNLIVGIIFIFDSVNFYIKIRPNLLIPVNSF